MLGEIGVRTKVAYEQLAKAHTMLCRADQDRQLSA